MPPARSDVLLARLKCDFNSISGRPFNYFYCPILQIDEEADLCKAHVINARFPNSNRAVTLQRKDVDNFFGTHFERDFMLMEFAHDADRSLSLEALSNRELGRIVRPRISSDGEVQDFYVSNSAAEIPQYHTEVRLAGFDKPIKLVIKATPRK